MSLVNNQTKALFAAFRPRIQEIEGRLQSEIDFTYCVQVYPESMTFNNFDPNMQFERWAAVSVNQLAEPPIGMEEYNISGGVYATFSYKGTIVNYKNVAHDFYTKWLPKSGYVVDKREHFEIMGTDYFGPFNPDSKEDIWIPVSRN